MNLQENIQRIREMMGVDESFLDWFKSSDSNNDDEDFLKSEEERFTCADCGEKDPVVLEFDHVRDKEKDVSLLLAGGYSLERILKEIDKCVIRCANCHRRKTAKDQNWYVRLTT